MATRPLLELTFTNFSVTLAANVAQPIKPGGALTDTIESFIVSLPLGGGGNSIFIGDSNVSLTTGVEVVPGAPLFFGIQQVRQLYELQYPLDGIATGRPVCLEDYQSKMIPFIAWNLSQLWAIASANTTFAVMTFKTPYY